VNEATNNLKLMLAPREKLNRLVFEPGEAGDLARKEFGDAYTTMMKREWYTIGIHLGFRYEGSTIIVPDGTPEPEDTVSTYEQTARPGHRAPHVWLQPGFSTLDLFGHDFVLVRFDPTATVSGFEGAATDSRTPFRVVDIENAEARALYGAKLVLVRPDGHVAWRGDTEPADPAFVIDVVRGMRSITTGQKTAQAQEAS
jgi:hypothetical protein